MNALSRAPYEDNIDIMYDFIENRLEILPAKTEEENLVAMQHSDSIWK